MAGGAGRITLWGVEVFAAVAEEGSVSAAARRLGASPATISQQLTNMEAGLATQLVNRDERPMRLTPAGETFLRRANAILNEADQARAELALGGLSHHGRVRLGMIEDFDADVTPRLLSHLAGDLRHARFLLETGPSHRLVDQLEARALDLVVCAEIGSSDPALTRVALLEEPCVAAVPRGALEGQDPAEALAAMPMIQYTRRHHLGRVIAAHMTQHDVRATPRFELDSYHAILAMVADGAGWSILTPMGWLRAHRFRGAVDLVPLPFAPLSRRILLMDRGHGPPDMPARMAAALRPMLAELIVAPAVTAHPWLAGSMRVLPTTPQAQAGQVP